MAIKNNELTSRLANFKNLFLLSPVIVSSGQFIPADWSRGVLQDPAIAKLVAAELAGQIDLSSIDVIAGIELQGVPLAMAMALETGKPMVIVREKPKRPGRSPIIGDVNFLHEGSRALLVDDLMAYGGTKEDRAKMLEERGGRVTDIAVFSHVRCTPPTQRTEGYNYDAESWLTERGIKLHPLLWHHELADLQANTGTISKELCEFIHHNADGPYWENPDNIRRLLDYMKRENVPILDHVLEHARKWGAL